MASTQAKAFPEDICKRLPRTVKKTDACAKDKFLSTLVMDHISYTNPRSEIGVGRRIHRCPRWRERKRCEVIQVAGISNWLSSGYRRCWAEIPPQTQRKAQPGVNTPFILDKYAQVLISRILSKRLHNRDFTHGIAQDLSSAREVILD